MAGSPTATGRPGLVTVPTPSPALNTMPLPAAQSGPSDDKRAMGDVGIVAGVLDDAGFGLAVAKPFVASAKAGVSPFGRRIATGSGSCRPATPSGRLGGRRGAGAGGPAARNWPSGFSVRSTDVMAMYRRGDCARKRP